MAYLRGEYYVWSDGDGINFWTPKGNAWLPKEEVEDFVCMYWHRIDEKKQKEIAERVSSNYGGGNFGADGVQRMLGRPTVMDLVNRGMST